MLNSPVKVGVCVPTIREEQISHFLRKWEIEWKGIAETGINLNLFIHEDQSNKSFNIDQINGLNIQHTCDIDIEEELKSRSWIIPRRTGACRSFPMLMAYKQGCDFIITMDDDCYPVEGEGREFISKHVSAFAQDQWYRTILGEEPRGIPYSSKGKIKIGLNHGLWHGVPDFDAPTALVKERQEANVLFREGTDIIPPGMAFSLCAMNVCYRREIIPAAYNLLMGIETVGFDRFDDIWSGVLLKKVIDHMGWYVSNGPPFVFHSKASNYFSNLRKEACGIQIHEKFWGYVFSYQFKNSGSVLESYRELAIHVGAFQKKFEDLPCQPDYFERLGEAMLEWTQLINEFKE